VANRNWIASWETFGLIDVGDGNIVLRASNSQYVCAEGSGGREILANRNWIGPWESFGLIDLGNGNIALRAFNGQYINAAGSGGQVMANSASAGTGETFALKYLA